MPDQITIDELKLFVGTGLKFRGYMDGLGDYEEELISVYPGGFKLSGNFAFAWDYATEGDIIHPIVRPLSNMTNNDMIQSGLITPKEGDEIMWDLLRKVSACAIHDGTASYRTITYLAGKGFDVFNWLNRTNPDGLPLAVEMEDNA